MGKTDDYRAILRGLTSWEPFLLTESNLPGPRANLELAFAVAKEGEEDLFHAFANLDDQQAPVNSPMEFIAFCGVLGLGYLVGRGQKEHLPRLRKFTSDPRWRIRESVALGLQEFGRQDMAGLLNELESWRDDNLFERRAIIAALCVPDLLEDPAHAERVFSLLDQITASLMEIDHRTAEGLQVLKKGLAYAWSVAVAAQPAIGKKRMGRWVKSTDKTIRWVMVQNLKKKRLIKMDGEWVANQYKWLG